MHSKVLCAAWPVAKLHKWGGLMRCRVFWEAIYWQPIGKQLRQTAATCVLQPGFFGGHRAGSGQHSIMV